MSHGAVTRHGPLDKNIGLEFTICFSCVLTTKMSFARQNPMFHFLLTLMSAHY